MNSDDIKKQLAKLRRDKRLLWFGILFFVVIVLWILVSIFATSKTSSVSAELRDLAKSFVPRLESKVFDEITGKRFFSEEELSSFPIYVFDKKNADGASLMIDIIAPLPELVVTPEIQQEIASESTIQASESATQATQEVSQNGDVLPASN